MSAPLEKMAALEVDSPALQEFPNMESAIIESTLKKQSFLQVNWSLLLQDEYELSVALLTPLDIWYLLVETFTEV